MRKKKGKMKDLKKMKMKDLILPASNFVKSVKTSLAINLACSWALPNSIRISSSKIKYLKTAQTSRRVYDKKKKNEKKSLVIHY